MPLIIAISGYHNSGKTTVGTYVVTTLRRQGFLIAVIKSTKEEGILTDREGSDTWRYRLAGANSVGLLQRNLLTLYVDTSSIEKENFFRFLQVIFEDYDLVLLEGFKNWKEIPKIWVLGEKDDKEVILKKYDNIELFVSISEKEKVIEYIVEKLKYLKEINK